MNLLAVHADVVRRFDPDPHLVALDRHDGHLDVAVVGPAAPACAEVMVLDFLREQHYSDGIPVRRSAAIL